MASKLAQVRAQRAALEEKRRREEEELARLEREAMSVRCDEIGALCKKWPAVLELPDEVFAAVLAPLADLTDKEVEALAEKGAGFLRGGRSRSRSANRTEAASGASSAAAGAAGGRTDVGASALGADPAGKVAAGDVMDLPKDDDIPE